MALIVAPGVQFSSAADALAMLDNELRTGPIVSIVRRGPEAEVGDWFDIVLAEEAGWEHELLVGLVWRARVSEPAARQRVFELLGKWPNRQAVVARIVAAIDAGTMDAITRAQALRTLVDATRGSTWTAGADWLRDAALDATDTGDGYALWLAHAPDAARPHLSDVIARASEIGLATLFDPYYGQDPNARGERLVELAAVAPLIADEHSRKQLGGLIRSYVMFHHHADTQLKLRLKASWSELDV